IFFFQAEDGIRDRNVTGVQTCALPISLETMINTSKKKLGQSIVVHCREEDKTLLKDLGVTAGKSIKTLGGIIAENKEGTKELDLTFEELLRTHEDQIKSFLSERM